MDDKTHPQSAIPSDQACAHKTRSPLVGVSSTDLVHMVDGAAMTDSRSIAERFGKQHNSVLRSIQALDCSNVFRRRNFAQSSYTNTQNKQQPMYRMTRDGFTFLVMGFTGKDAATWKERYIAAFNAMEQQLRSAVPQSLPEALRLAADEAEKRAAAEAALAEAQPKALALDRIASAEGSLSMTDAAKTLKMQPRKFIAYLSGLGWIYKRPATTTWIAYQEQIGNNHLEHRDHTYQDSGGSERIATQVRVTAKGLTKLAKLLESTHDA